MTLSKYNWLFVVVATLLFSFVWYTLPRNAKSEQRIYYYNERLGEVALETHRVSWSTRREQNVCTTVREQILPAYSYDAIVLAYPPHLSACLFRRGNVYINFTQSELSTASSSRFAEETGVHILDMVKMALHLNHRYVRQIFISIDGLPWSMGV